MSVPPRWRSKACNPQAALAFTGELLAHAHRGGPITGLITGRLLRSQA